MQNNIIEMEGIIEGYKAEDGKSPHKFFFLEDGKESTVVLQMWWDFNSKEEKAYIKPLIEEYGSLKELIGYKATVYVVEQKPQTDSEGNFVRSQYALSSITVGSNVGKPEGKQAVRATTNRFAGSSDNRSSSAGDRVEGIRLGGTRSMAIEITKEWMSIWYSYQENVTRHQYLQEAKITAKEATVLFYDIDATTDVPEPFQQVDQSYDEVV